MFTSFSSFFVHADSSALIFGDRDFSKSDLEKDYQTMLATGLTNILGAGGYAVSNYQGEGTLKANILSQVHSKEQSYGSNLVIYFLIRTFILLQHKAKPIFHLLALACQHLSIAEQ